MSWECQLWLRNLFREKELFFFLEQISSAAFSQDLQKQWHCFSPPNSGEISSPRSHSPCWFSMVLLCHVTVTYFWHLWQHPCLFQGLLISYCSALVKLKQFLFFPSHIPAQFQWFHWCQWDILKLSHFQRQIRLQLSKNKYLFRKEQHLAQTSWWATAHLRNIRNTKGFGWQNRLRSQ